MSYLILMFWIVIRFKTMALTTTATLCTLLFAECASNKALDTLLRVSMMRYCFIASNLLPVLVTKHLFKRF